VLGGWVGRTPHDFSRWFDHRVENTFGVQVRNDWIHNGLYQSENRVRVDKTDSSTGNNLPATTQADRFTDTRPGFWVENKIQWEEKFRSVAALRGDLDYFDVTSLVNPVPRNRSFRNHRSHTRRGRRAYL
jgi:hypothetical protein